MEKQTMDRNRQNIDKKREKEKKIVNTMIEIYCRGHKHREKGICENCLNLMSYSNKRVDKCPFMETKTFCQNCRVHCFKKDMRNQIKEVMRYSGPRMLFRHPFLTIEHGIESYKEKRRRRKQINDQ